MTRYVPTALRPRRRRRDYRAWLARERRCARCQIDLHWLEVGVLQRVHAAIDAAEAILEARGLPIPDPRGPLGLRRRWWKAHRAALRTMGFRADEPLGHLDHIQPLWAGGTDQDENVQLLCQTCHAGKSKVETGQRARHKPTWGRPWGEGRRS